jgi:hypothetical protein
MLGYGIEEETECNLLPSQASINSALPKYRRIIAFLTLQMLNGS